MTEHEHLVASLCSQLEYARNVWSRLDADCSEAKRVAKRLASAIEAGEFAPDKDIETALKY